VAAGAGGIDDGGDVFAFLGDECGFAASAKLFPAVGTREIGVGWGFGD
jgi:hypothetical protein